MPVISWPTVKSSLQRAHDSCERPVERVDEQIVPGELPIRLGSAADNHFKAVLRPLIFFRQLVNGASSGLGDQSL